MYPTTRKLPTLLLKPLRLHVFSNPPPSLSASKCTDLNIANNTRQHCGTLPDILSSTENASVGSRGNSPCCATTHVLVWPPLSRTSVLHTICKLWTIPYKTQTSIQVTSIHFDPQDIAQGLCRCTKIWRIPGRSHSEKTANQDFTVYSLQSTPCSKRVIKCLHEGKLHRHKLIIGSKIT